MAEKNQQMYPVAPARGDEESLAAKDEKRKKMIKWARYIATFTISQVPVIVIFSLVIMKVRTPRFRVGDGLQVRSLKTQPTPPSFNLTFSAPIRVKNANFGPYKYDAMDVVFTYDGVTVGKAAIPKGKANFRSTKKINVLVLLSSASLPRGNSLGSEMRSGRLTLRSKGTMTGKVEVMLVFEKKKSTAMDCTMIINVSSLNVQSVECMYK